MLRLFVGERTNGGNNFLRHVFCGGGVLSPELQEQFHERFAADLHNVYGPTETSIDAAFWTCKRDGHQSVIPIGHPIANKQIFLLDSHQQLVPIGVPGELYIGGLGLARGYLHRPDLTAERFIPDPFSDSPGARLYRSGDLARYLSDGEIEFLGRIDEQVKVRGYRVEPAEIEAVLNEHRTVRSSVVLPRKDARGESSLVAYFVASEQTLSISDLRSYLRTKLPEHLVPSRFAILENLPLTPNGKIDTQALPELSDIQTEMAAAYLAPRNEVEHLLTKIWRETLELEQIGVNDNFFDLGGHSIAMLEIYSKVHDVFDRELSIVEMFSHPTIGLLAEYLSGETSERSSLERSQVRAETSREATKRRLRFRKQRLAKGVPAK
jgi:acyl carrier protein